MADDDEEKQNTFFGLSAIKAQTCSTKKLQDERILEKIFLFQIIGSFGDIKEEKKEKWLKNYIQMKRSSVFFILECIKEI